MDGELRNLGRTDLRVTPIGLGTWQFSEGKGLGGRYWPALPQETVDAIVRATLEGGINWFDTAELYGHGASEAALARALRAAGRRPGDVVVATKWSPILRTAGSIRRTIDDRLRHLDGFPVDLHQVHSPWGALATHAAEMRALADLVERGLIGAIGVSNFSARQMRRADAALRERGLRLTANQVRYGILDRRAERNGTLDAARELGVTLIAYSPLEQGLATGKFHQEPERLKRLSGPRRFLPAFRRRGLEKSRPVVEALAAVARDHDTTAAQVALAWLVRFHGEAVVAIPGASSEKQARQNAAALRVELTRDELRRLDEVSRPFLAGPPR